MEEEIKEAEIEEQEKKSRFGKIKWINMELAFFLILGFLLGIAIKTEAAKRVTVGFDDYKISSLKQGYDFGKIQKDLAAQSASNASGGDANNSNGGVNSDNSNQAEGN